jgi:O-methyltransferase involved in polyketide biosynthesis
MVTHPSRSHYNGGVGMQQDKIKIKLSGVSETLLGPLWSRARLSKEYSPLFYDAKAVELVEKIDYDFSTSDMPFEGIMFNISRKGNLPAFGLWALRAKQFDEKVKAYVKGHPQASVVNIGAGLDATFYRVDNGTIRWYDLDLPAVIDIRRHLLPEPDRVTYIAKSFLDPSWCKDIKHTEEGVFIIAGGLLRYFEEAHVQQFFSMLADNFPGGEIIFNASSRVDNHFGAWVEQLPPEQQKEAGAVLIETREEMWHNFGAFSRWGVGLGKWALKDVKEITRWDDRITVIDQSPLFKDIPRDSLSADIQRVMDYSDESGRSSIFHLRV